MQHSREYAITAFIGLVGVAVFVLFKLPLPWLLGPLFGCLIAAIVGVNLRGIRIASEISRTALGVAVGASITVALVSRLDTMLLSIALIPLFILAIGAVGYPLFRHVGGYDRATAYYAAMPGGLADMLIFGEAAGANVRTLSLIQVTRVLVVVSALPFLLGGYYQLDLSAPPGRPLADKTFDQIAIMLVCAAFGWWVAKRVGLLGPAILGPLIIAAIASLSGILTVRPPAEAIIAAQFFIGLHVGAKYTGITNKELRHDILMGMAYCVLALAITTLFCALIVSLEIAPEIETLLAFAPGGQAEMALIALIAGADMAHVVAHHLIRILTVIFGAPLFFRLFK
jgi:membrane AbrB-like protein